MGGRFLREPQTYVLKVSERPLKALVTQPSADPADKMAAIESAAVFRSRAKAMDLLDVDVDAMAARGWRTFATFAFASSYVPGQGPDEAFRREVVEVVLGAQDHVRAPSLRRLYYESYTLVASDMRNRVERSGDEPARKIPAVERAVRFRALAAKLPGLGMDQTEEPANFLVDRYNAMLEDGVLKYIHWEELASRKDELYGLKKTKEWKVNSSGHLMEVVSDIGPRTEVSTDLKVLQALNRRGAAMELSNLMDYQVHDKLTRMLMREFQRDTVPGFHRVALDQLHRADKEVWAFMAERTRDGLMPDAAGARPLDDLLPQALLDPTVRMMLLPLPGAQNKRRADDNEPPSTKASKRAKKKARQEAAQTSAPRGPPPRNPKGDGKGQGKTRSMPGGLLGNSKTAEGKSICFGYNLGN